MRLRHELRAAGWAALSWALFLLLVNPYLLLRAKGDELRGWYHLGDLERAVFQGRTPTTLLQRGIYSHDLVWLDFAGFALHLSWFFLPFVAGILVTVFERDRLPELLGWLIAAFYVAALSFLVFPVRPPWMDPGVHRVLVERSFINYTGIDNNPVAAFPSLHACIPMLLGLFFALRGRRLRFLRGLFFALALAIGFAVVYLGEHWVLDVLGGYALAGAVAYLFVSRRMHRLYARIPGQPVARLSRLNGAISRYGPSPAQPPHEAAHTPADLPRAA
ncbi:MAG: phosphatase PAP2 family protein [Hyphomicrobiales bacterium]